MNADLIDFSTFPYRKFSEIRIKNNEPLSYAYLNSHLIRLCSNLESLGITNTLQKATYEQWGTVKKASESDITDSENGIRTSVLTNDLLNRVMESMRSENADLLFREKRLNISKNYEFKTGDFVVGTNEKIAKKITSSPSKVVFTRIDIFPVGFDEKPFYTTKKSKTTKESYLNGTNAISSGIINFTSWNTPDNYGEFHVYYHPSGYVICNNGKIDGNQKQIKVVWIQLIKKS